MAREHIWISIFVVLCAFGAAGTSAFAREKDFKRREEKHTTLVDKTETARRNAEYRAKNTKSTIAFEVTTLELKGG